MITNTFNPANGDFVIDEIKISGGLSIEGFLQTPLFEKCKKKVAPTLPFDEFIYTPLTIWNKRFRITLRFEQALLKEIVFFWLDGDLAPREEWDDIVQADFAGDFESLSKTIENAVQMKPSEKKFNMKKWNFSWGEIQTWWEDKSYTEGIALSWNK